MLFEIFIIFVIALVVIPPKRMPEVARFIGRVCRFIKRFRDDLHAKWDEMKRLELLEENEKRAKMVEEKTNGGSAK